MMKPPIQIIHVPSPTATENNSYNAEQLPFDISHVDGEDGLRAKFLEALSYDDLGELYRRFTCRSINLGELNQDLIAWCKYYYGIEIALT